MEHAIFPIKASVGGCHIRFWSARGPTSINREKHPVVQCGSLEAQIFCPLSLRFFPFTLLPSQTEALECNLCGTDFDLQLPII